MKKGKIILCLAQLAIIGFFIVLAAGSSESEMSSFAKGVSQGADCSSRGFTFIGYYESISDCSNACEKKGYTYYCTGENTVSCYCK
ncbi:MAG: hypothetical protein MJZ56_06225 [Bacteroidales bacterium]|nr:hypothetical protein [Bacteroidales bacterium]